MGVCPLQASSFLSKSYMSDDLGSIQFCEEVEKFPCLYDNTRFDYRNRATHGPGMGVKRRAFEKKR